MNKFIVVSLMALAFVNPNPEKADMAVEAKLRLLGSKLVKIDTAIATGSCASCAGSLAVLKADLAKLAALPNLLQGERDALTEIDRKADALDQKLDQLPSLTAKEVVNQLTAKYGAGWEEAARKPSNTCSTYVDALKGAGTDAQALKALADAIGKCAEQGAVATELAKVVCINGGVVKTNTMTVVCDKPPRPAAVPPAALLPPPAPVVTSSRTFAGWALSGLGGAAAGAAVGWYAGNEAKAVKMTDRGLDWGGAPPGALIGAFIGAAAGAVVYGLASTSQ